MRPQNYNFSQGFLSLVSLLIVLVIIILLMFSIYFGFNRGGFGSGAKPDQSKELSPQEAIQKAENIKELLESQEKLLE